MFIYKRTAVFPVKRINTLLVAHTHILPRGIDITIFYVIIWRNNSWAALFTVLRKNMSIENVDRLKLVEPNALWPRPKDAVLYGASSDRKRACGGCIIESSGEKMSANVRAIQDETGVGELSAHLAPRMASLRSDVMLRKGSWIPGANPFERDVALWRTDRPGVSVVQWRAHLLLELVQISAIEIYPGWRLAGEHFSGYGFGFARPDAEALLEQITSLGLSNEEIPAARESFTRFNRLREHTFEIGMPDESAPHVDSVFHAWGWVENHSIRDYAKVLAKGFKGIQQEILDKRNASVLSDPEYPQQENFWNAALAICEAGCLLGNRYADLAETLASRAESDEERARLARMAKTCRHVPAQGARNLFEAVQSLWLAHILTCGEDYINANSIGRLDQILGPYYEQDLAKGETTRAGAVELMEELACKLYLDYDVQAITLGGQDRDGQDATNEMTYAIMDATHNVGFVRDVSVRLHSGSPAGLVEQAAGLVARGGGIPFFFNDDCFIPALTERGIALEDARGYAPIGCIELTIPGRANPHAVSGWFNSLKCLELALFDGKDPHTGEQLGPKTGRLTDYDSYEALYGAYSRQVEHFAQAMVYHCNRGELAQREAGPLPYLSTLTGDCINRGRDITDGGAIYNYHSVCFLGAADTADSLCALKRLVFEEKSVSSQEILSALEDNFEDHEPLRQQLLNRAPKYGNDIDEVDSIAANVAMDFIRLMDTERSPLGGRYFVHLFTFLCNIDYGKLTGATPDGRHAGEPLAYSLSAHQGRDQEGITAMLRSLAKMPHRHAAGASAAIVDVDPKLIEGADGVKRLAQIIRTAMRMGVGQLQMNVTTAGRLLKAQEDPERFGNIPVRVAGYSQMFKLLTKDLQDHVIARTKHAR